MDDSTPAPPAREASRRWFLAGGIAVLLGAAGGGAAEVLRPHRPRAAPVHAPPPAALVAALDAERALIANLDATTGGAPAVRSVITQIRADHAQHRQALTALVAQYGRAPAVAPGSSAAGGGVASSTAQLHAAELRASAQAARRATGFAGRTAALLASIAACEATHAELLA